MHMAGCVVAIILYCNCCGVLWHCIVFLVSLVAFSYMYYDKL